MLAAAVAYADRGWPAHPLRGKVPLVPDWPTAASLDHDQLRAWWARWPAANVGIVTGPRSGLAVLDVDPRNGGRSSLAKLEEQELLLGTLMQITGGGGLHILYQHPGHKVKSHAGALGAGLDVKGDGGQIVAAPSLHPDTGERYAWSGDARFDHPLSPWPGRLDELLTPAHAVVDLAARREAASRQVAGSRPYRRLKGLVNTVLSSAEGRRDTVLNWAAYTAAADVVSTDYPAERVAHALIAAAQQTGLSEREARGTVSSAFRAAGLAS